MTTQLIILLTYTSLCVEVRIWDNLPSFLQDQEDKEDQKNKNGIKEMDWGDKLPTYVQWTLEGKNATNF